MKDEDGIFTTPPILVKYRVCPTLAHLISVATVSQEVIVGFGLCDVSRVRKFL